MSKWLLFWTIPYWEIEPKIQDIENMLLWLDNGPMRKKWSNFLLKEGPTTNYVLEGEYKSFYDKVIVLLNNVVVHKTIKIRWVDNLFYTLPLSFFLTNRLTDNLSL